jgi:hypothetical protein
MLFDPEDGMTLEQSIEIAWNNLVSPSMRARVLAVAQATGRTRNEIILKCREEFLKGLEDPAKAAAYHAKMDREFAPFGPDPLMRKNP